MTLLCLGLLIWVTVHLFPSVFADHRNALIDRLGENAYKGLFSLCIIVALLMIVFGWRSSIPTLVYIAPVFAWPLALAMITLGFLLVVAANFPATRIKRAIRHPQLTGVALWAAAHLSMNGDSSSLILFSTLGVWSFVSMATINRRDGAWEKPDPPDGWGQDIAIIVVGLVLAALAYYFHEYLSGIPIAV